MPYKKVEEKQTYNANYWEKLKADPLRHERRKANGRAYYDKNKEKLSLVSEKARVKRLYEIDYETYLNLLKGNCQICGNESEVLDHCHKTNKIRGALCSNCNHGLGQFKDSSTFCRAAADYLESFEDKQLSHSTAEH